MNKFTTIATAAALMVSSSVFAFTNTVYGETVHKTEGFATVQDAYNSGFNYVDSFQNMSANELEWTLSIMDETAKHIVIDGAEVKVEEFAKTRGDVQYRALVEVDYHYSATDHGHND